MEIAHKHQCKFCFKSFPSGRSLGGHMHSHMAATSLMKSSPAKSSGAVTQQWKDCSKEFPLQSALISHTGCHSDHARSIIATDTVTHLQPARVPRKKRGWRPLEYDADQKVAAVSLMLLSRDATIEPSLVKMSSLKSDEPPEYDADHPAAPLHQPHQPYPYYATLNPNPNPYAVAYETTTPLFGAVASGASSSRFSSLYQPDSYSPHGENQAAAYGFQPSVTKATGSADAAGVMTSATVPCYYAASSRPEALSVVNYSPTTARVGKRRNFEDMKIKPQKLIEGGSAADSVRKGVPGSVVCNSETVYATHLAGEKHSLKVYGHPPKGANAAGAAISATVKAENSNKVLKMASQKKAKVVQVEPVSCNTCKLNCGTEEVLATHMLGKKHIRNMKKLESLRAKRVTKVQPVGVGDKQRQRAEDLEAKKQAMLDNGTPADAIKVCTVCSIPCNGQAAFDSHVSGQRHINLLKLSQQPVSNLIFK